MTVRRSSMVLLVLSGCGPLELGSYAEPEENASEGATGGAMSVAGSFSLGAGHANGGGSSNNAERSGGAGLGGVAIGGSTGSTVAGSGFGGAGVDGAAGDSGLGGSSGFAGGSLDGVAGGGGAGSAGGGAGGSSGGSGGPGGVLDQSCRGLEGQCSEHFNCCASSFISTEEFVLGWEGFSATARVTVFYPDALEVTVGRFARFADAFEKWTAAGNPRAGAAEHTFIPGTGWQSDFRLPASREALEKAVTSCAFVNTYTMRDTNPELPMNCVSWFEAFAFCAWDGKRLLTEAEWELAAKGGVEDRLYPWGNDPEPTSEHAVHGCLAWGLGAPHCEPEDVVPVGSRPLGNSRHGLRDLAGSVAEWVFDKEDLYEDPCEDCANTESENNPTLRMFRGGGYSSAPALLAAERRNAMDAGARLDFLGFRCARSLLY